MNKATERLYNGIIKENPTLVLLLGMCPTMAVTTKAVNGLGMGLTTMAVLALSNLIISILRKVIPDRVRIPAFIVIIASFVTVIQLLLQAYLPWLYTALGVYIPLIVVNCIILGRAESYAYKNPPIPSLFDGIGMGFGFTLSLTVIGCLRELLGDGTLFERQIMPSGYVPIRIFALAPGAFFVMALLCTLQNVLRSKRSKTNANGEEDQTGCIKDCSACGESGCGLRLYDDSKNPDKNKDQSLPEEPVKSNMKQEINLSEISEKVKLSEETVRLKVKAELEKEEETEKKEAGKEGTGEETEKKEAGKEGTGEKTEKKEAGKEGTGEKTEKKEIGKEGTGEKTEKKEIGKEGTVEETEKKEIGKEETEKEEMKQGGESDGEH